MGHSHDKPPGDDMPGNVYTFPVNDGSTKALMEPMELDLCTGLAWKKHRTLGNAEECWDGTHCIGSVSYSHHAPAPYSAHVYAGDVRYEFARRSSAREWVELARGWEPPVDCLDPDNPEVSATATLNYAGAARCLRLAFGLTVPQVAVATRTSTVWVLKMETVYHEDEIAAGAWLRQLARALTKQPWEVTP